MHLTFHFHFKSLQCLSHFYLVHRIYEYDSSMLSLVLHGIGRITFKNPRPKVGELHALLNDGFIPSETYDFYFGSFSPELFVCWFLVYRCHLPGLLGSRLLLQLGRN